VAYTCSAGDSLSGSTCTHSTSSAAAVTYTCPSGGTPSGGQCIGAAGTTKTAYIYLGGKQIAEKIVGGNTQYVHTDALGSPVAHTNASGQELNRTRFEPYGYTAAGTKPGPATSVIGFTGHVNDPETDLVYMQQRYYDPIAGRFLSVDPVVTDANTGKSFGLYTYVDNNPYAKVDPDGRDPDRLFGISVGLFMSKEAGTSLAQANAGIGNHSVGQGVAIGQALNALANGKSPEASAAVLIAALAANRGTGNKNAPKSDLPRGKGGEYKPHPDAEGAHSTIGTRVGSDGAQYRQAATFDDKGKFLGRTDVTDHGSPQRPGHTNPHHHPATGPASVGPATPGPLPPPQPQKPEK
jgi:RHS repeat-associated protein